MGQRMVRQNPMLLPQAPLLRATQRLAAVIGINATLRALNETHFEQNNGNDPTQLATFVCLVGPFTQWREVRVLVSPELLTWGTFAQEEAFIFMLCVAHTWLETGTAWYPKEPTKHTITTCEACGVRCDNSLSPTARAYHPPRPLSEAEMVDETRHLGPDQ